ncbi:TonB-dependent receptor [Pedobacter polaris]|nr:TonB-dependent receptor [Pedobacter polaris]
MQVLSVAKSAGQSTSDVYKITAPITLQINNTDLDQVLTKLNGQAGYRYSYDNNQAKAIKINKLNLNQIPLGKVLLKLQDEASLTYSMDGKSIMVRIGEGKKIERLRPGKITGTVVDEKGQPMPGASIKIVETGNIVQTDVDGRYSMTLAEGIYTFEVSYISYQKQRITGIQVTGGKSTPLDIAMKTDTQGLKEVVITADYKNASIAGLYARQKNNASMSDGITAEQISRTPDNNTAQVLKRVSGLQVSQNKYVVVRGLSDRYNNVLLNGNQLPSTEPNRRDFAFDMIPSGLVDNIIVNKTATPDLPGEFTGGLVQVNTKDIPEENFVTLSIGSGLNTQATGKDFIGGQRGQANFFGYANDYQKKPEGMTFAEYNVLANKIDGSGASSDEKQKAAQFLNQFPDNWAMRRYTAQPIQNYALTVGRSIPIKKNKLGIIAAFTYRNEQTAEQDDQYAPGSSDYKGTDYTFTTLMGGSLNLGYVFGKNKFTLKNTYNRRFSDKLYQFNGIDIQSGDSEMNGYSALTLINELFQSSLAGEHAFGARGIKLDYNLALSTLQRDQPNSRIMNMVGPPVGGNDSAPDQYYEYRFNDYQPEYGSLFYSDLKEKRYAYQTNLSVPFKLLNLNQTLKFGYQGSYRKADFNAESYRIKKVLGATKDFNGSAYTDVYTNKNFVDQQLFLLSFTGAGTSIKAGSPTAYNGSQQLNAYYGMVDLKPIEKLRLIGGMRLEQNNQKVFTNTVGKITNPNEITPLVDSLISIVKNDWLPSLNAIYAVNAKMNIRAAYYKTVARPDLKELSSFSYFDFEVFRTISGNNLKPTQIKNYDLRYEFYPGPDEIISVSGFYKKFTNPIELTFEPTSAKPLLIYKNLSSARDLGFEVDFRKSLRFFSSSSAFWKNLYLSGSFTWVDASVDLGPGIAVDAAGKSIASKRDRPLYGQSPYIINGGINFVGKRVGLNAVYNRYGKRVVTSTAYTSADEYENPRDVVDLQLSYKFLRAQRAELRLNISDLLNQQFITYKNQYGPDHPVYAEADPSVERYPGDGSVALSADQLDPKGTSYNPVYDVVTFRRRNGINYTLNFIYRF